MTTLTKITFSPENEAKAKEWLANRGGIAVWTNKDLGSPSIGCETFTPALTDGKPTLPPHWNLGKSPDRIVTDSTEVMIAARKEVARVKIRRGPPYLGGVHRTDHPKLDAAMEAAGESASWHPDCSGMSYGSPWFVAVVTVQDGLRALSV